MKRRRRDAPREQYANETIQYLTETGTIDPKDLVSRSGLLPTTTVSPTQRPAAIDDSEQPYVCFNKSQVAPDPKRVYGYFSRTVTVRSEHKSNQFD